MSHRRSRSAGAPEIDGEGRDDPDDAIDRTFGLDPRVVPRRTGRQRTRTAILTAVVVVVAGGLVAGALVVVVDRVQSGIGGVFPQPGATLARFEARAAGMPAVASTADLAERQTEIFAGYDVVALVRAEDGLTDGQQRRLVEDLSAEAATETGKGVAVYARAQFGDLSVAVSPDRSLSDQRLSVGQQIAAMGGVTSVRCVWSSTPGDPIDDSATRQVVTVGTTASDADYPALVAAVTTAVHATLPAARVTVTRPESPAG